MSLSETRDGSDSVVRDVGQRLRVLQIGKYYPPHHGGIETHLQLLCEGLGAEVELEVVVASDTTETSEEVMRGVSVARLGTALTFAGAPISRGMVRRIRESRADIVHLHLPNPAAVLAYLASGHRGQLVVSYHSDVVRQRMLELAFRPFLHLLLNRASAVMVATPNYIESSSILSGLRDRCRVVPYGISLEHFDRTHGAADDVRRTYGERLIVAVGRLVYYKGFESLISAMRGVNGRLLIVGDGPLRGRLEEQIAALNLGSRVTLVGAVEDVIPYYQAADIFVLPSVARSEAFGIVQLEAMACAKPVVNTSLDSGVPYVSRDGESGLTVPPDDPGALAKAIMQLLNDQALRDRFGETARARVEDEFTQEIMVRRTLDLYHEVCASPRFDRRAAVAGAAPAGNGSVPVSMPS